MKKPVCDQSSGPSIIRTVKERFLLHLLKAASFEETENEVKRAAPEWMRVYGWNVPWKKRVVFNFSLS